MLALIHKIHYYSCMFLIIILVLIVINIGLIALVIFNPKLTKSFSGKILVFITLFILPVLTVVFSITLQFHNSKTTQFCLSCHIMEPYGRSLLIDDERYIPAYHYQNNLISQEDACFTCHTTYTLFGDINAKLSGLGHFFNYYLGGKYEHIKLKNSFNNRECLHCHGEARIFLEGETHNPIMEKLVNNEQSCLHCHGPFHSVESLDHFKFWQKEEAK